jgi:hypothetical protein
MDAGIPKDFQPGEALIPMKPAASHDVHDLRRLYWMNGGTVMCGPAEVPGADPETFVFYVGCFAKDKRHCYFFSGKLRGANPNAFHALNFTYYKDDRFVWTMGGKVKDAIAESFVACDSGIFYLAGRALPHSYGKDARKVFYYDFNGKPCWVRKANPETFASFDDGHFGRDDRFAFYGHAAIPKVDIGTWTKLGASSYSKDGNRVYFLNRVISSADLASFRVIPSSHGMQLARDSNHFYWNDRVIDHDKSGAAIWTEYAQPDVAGDAPPAAGEKSERVLK